MVNEKNKNFRNVMFKLKTWIKLMEKKRTLGYQSVDAYVNALLEASIGWSKLQIEIMGQIKTPDTAINDEAMFRAIGLDHKNWHKVGETSETDSASVGENKS